MVAHSHNGTQTRRRSREGADRHGRAPRAGGPHGSAGAPRTASSLNRSTRSVTSVAGHASG